MKDQFIDIVKGYIKRNYTQIEFIEDISSNLNCNYHSLRHDFLIKTGKTLGQYLNEIKCRKAAELLENTNWKVYKIAFEVGFRDDKYFIRVFEKLFGMSPQAYRKFSYLRMLNIIHMFYILTALFR
ncbi:MAG: helix-turn-helix transcriptional regulator [Candidatus Thorarchaeota archaeon]